MGMRFSNLIGVLVLAVASTSVLAASAIAQIESPSFQPRRLEPISDTFNRAFSNESGDFFRNRSFPRQWEYILGPGSLQRPGFPEAEDARDQRLIEILYQDTLYEQVSSDPIIRTPDLPNPYNTSVLMMPSTLSNVRVRGSEFIYERVPPR